MKNIFTTFLLAITLFNCNSTPQDTEKETKPVSIGFGINDENEKVNLIPGDSKLIEIWQEYLAAHEANDLDKIYEMDADDITIYRIDGSVGKGKDEHREYLENWFENSTPKWEAKWCIANTVENIDGSLETWLTTGSKFSDFVDGEEILTNTVADFKFEDEKVKSIYIYSRNVAKE